MFEAILSGILFGLSAGFSPGPLMVLVITFSLTYSMRDGFKIAVAPLLTDLPIVISALLLIEQFSGNDPLLGVVSLAGGLFVFYLAWETLKTKGVDVSKSQKAPQSLRKGILVNLLSPHPYLFWFTVGAPLMVTYNRESWKHSAGFVFCFYFCLVGSKMIAALLAAQSRSIIKGRPYIYTMRVLGLLLMAFGVILLKDALERFEFLHLFFGTVQ